MGGLWAGLPVSPPGLGDRAGRTKGGEYGKEVVAEMFVSSDRRLFETIKNKEETSGKLNHTPAVSASVGYDGGRCRSERLRRNPHADAYQSAAYGNQAACTDGTGGARGADSNPSAKAYRCANSGHETGSRARCRTR